MYCHSLAG